MLGLAMEVGKATVRSPASLVRLWVTDNGLRVQQQQPDGPSGRTNTAPAPQVGILQTRVTRIRVSMYC